MCLYATAKAPRNSGNHLNDLLSYESQISPAAAGAPSPDHLAPALEKIRAFVVRPAPQHPDQRGTGDEQAGRAGFRHGAGDLVMEQHGRAGEHPAGAVFDVVGVDGVSPLFLNGILSDNYYIAIAVAQDMIRKNEFCIQIIKCRSSH